jgi:aminoglycoside phosphotransferase
VNDTESELLHWLEHHLGPTARIDFDALPGATSATVRCVRVGGERRAVLRQFTDAAWLEREADLPRHEAAALVHAERHGLPAPRLIAVSDDLAMPLVLMTYVHGRVELTPREPRAWLAALAESLARIHATPCGDFAWRYASWSRAPHSTPPAWFRDIALWRRMRHIWQRGAPLQQARFLHRDFHPVNVLWRHATPSGVVDWVNACCGPAGVDVAHCRINLALMYGQRRADEFLRLYRQRSGGYLHDPFWDIDAALGWTARPPAYYSPWRQFGLRRIGSRELADRTRRFVAAAVAQAQ